MNRQALADELNLLLATETRSLFRHLGEAKPYLTPRTIRAWNQLKPMAHAYRDHGDRLAALLDRLELPIRSAAFPTSVANYHFTNVETLLPELITEMRSQVQAYERAVRHADDQPAVAGELARLLEENRLQLHALETAQASLYE